MKFRLPNESIYTEGELDMNLFTMTSDWGDEVFGWYDGKILIAIKKEDGKNTQL